MTATPLVYIDTMIIVYAVEGLAELASELRHLAALIETASITAVTSELTVAEVMVKPAKTADLRLRAAYNDALRPDGPLALRSISREILQDAADIRGRYGTDLADAIHLATSIAFGCEHFLTRDFAMKIPPAVQRLHIQDITHLKVRQP